MTRWVLLAALSLVSLLTPPRGHAETCEAACAAAMAACVADCTTPPDDGVVLEWLTYGESGPLGPTCLPTTAASAFGARSRLCSYYRAKIARYEADPVTYAAALAQAVEVRQRITHTVEAAAHFTALDVEHYGDALRPATPGNQTYTADQGYELWIEDFDTGLALTPRTRLTVGTTTQTLAVNVIARAGQRLACAWASLPQSRPAYAYPTCALSGTLE